MIKRIYIAVTIICRVLVMLSLVRLLSTCQHNQMWLCWTSYREQTR